MPVVLLMVLGLGSPTAAAAPGTVSSRVLSARASGAPTISPAVAEPAERTVVRGRLPTRVRRPVVLQMRRGAGWTERTRGTTSRVGGFTLITTAPRVEGAVAWRVVAPRVGGARRLATYTSAAGRSVVRVPPAAPDTMPPVAPDGLTLVAGDGSLRLTWRASASADVDGYVVYRAQDPAGPWMPVSGSEPLARLTWTATGLPNDLPASFAVAAVDTAGNISTRSAPVTGTPHDGVAPTRPTGLAAASGDGLATLSWQPVAAPDVVGYRVLRAAGDDTWEPVSGPEPITGSWWTATGLTNGAAYTFAVVAVDASGNESPLSTPVVVVPRFRTGPGHCGTLTRDETWGPGATHVLDCAVVVPAGVTLTIEPGATVKSARGGLVVGGALVVDGGSGDEVVSFTALADDSRGGDTNGDADATSPSWGAWEGIRVLDGASADLSHAELAYAGIALAVDGGGHLSLVSSRLADDGFGVDVAADGTADVQQSLFVRQRFTGVNANADAVVEIAESEFSDGGTGVQTASTSVASVLRSTFADLAYGVAVGGVTTRVEDSTFERVHEAPVQLAGAGVDIAHVVHGNTAADSGVNGVRLDNPVFADGARLVSRPDWGLVVVTRSTVNVPAGSTVTVEPGTVVKMQGVQATFGVGGSTLDVAGTLISSGTDAAPAAFTAVTDDSLGGDTDGDHDVPTYGRHFEGLAVADGGLISLQHTTVQDAGIAVTVWDGGRLEATGSVLARAVYGVDVEPGGSATLDDSTFRGLSQVGLNVGGDASGTVTGSRFRDGRTGVQTVSTSAVSITGSDFQNLRDGVIPGGVGTVVEHNDFDQITEAPVLVDGGLPFDPRNIDAGNLATSSGVNGIWMRSPVLADGAELRGRAGWTTVVSNVVCGGCGPQTVNVPEGATVTVPPGAVVKFRGGSDTSYTWRGSLNVAGTLLAQGDSGSPAILTSFDDDNVGGDTDGDAPVPFFGHFDGVHVLPGGTFGLDYATIARAGTAITNDGDVHATRTRILGGLGTVCLSAPTGVTSYHGSLRGCTVGIAAGPLAPVDARGVDWGAGLGPGVLGNPTAVGLLIDYFPWLGVTSIAPIASTPVARPTKVDGACTPYLFIGVRGSGEPSDGDGLGGKVVHIREGLPDDVAAQTATIGLPYDATTIPFSVGSATLAENLAETVNYVPGAWDGAVRLVNQIRASVAECGSSGQKILVAGYSQGAWVIHTAVSYLNATDPDTLDAVSAVALLADPLRTPSAPANLGTANQGTGIAASVVGTAALELNRYLRVSDLVLFPDVPDVHMGDVTYPDSLGSRTVTMCDSADTVCDVSTPLAGPDEGMVDRLKYGADHIHAGYEADRLKAMGARLAQLAAG